MPEGYIKGKPDIGFWIRQIKHGLDFRRMAASEDRWPSWRNMYRGDWRGDILPSNIFFKMVRTTVPRIYFRNPSVSIIPRKPGAEGFLLSQLLERTDNKLIRQMKLKKHIKRIVQDAFMFGTGVGKIGFGSQYHATPETIGETEAPLIRGRNSVEYNFDLIPNMPWYARWPVANYVLPQDTINKEDARWECFVVRRPVKDIQDDTRLRNTRDIKATPRQFSINSRPMQINPAIEEADLFEIRDKKTGRVFIITPTLTDKILFDGEDEFNNLGIEVGKILVFNDDDERVWGIPDSKILEPLQRELNEIRTFTMYHRRLSIVKILVQRGQMKKEEARKLISEEVGAVAFTEGNPDLAVKIIQASSIPNDLLTAELAVLRDVRETVGFGRNEFGEFQGGRESPTATEASIVKAASEIRVDERRDMVADMLVSVVNDINPIIFEHWTQEQVVEVVGPGGVPIWVAFKPTMLKRAQYEVNVDPDQQVPQTKDLREQKSLVVYNTLKTNPLIDPLKLTRYLLHEIHGVAFDDMIRGIPQGMGLNPDTPLSIGEFQRLLQNTQRSAAQLQAQPGDQANVSPIRGAA